MSAAMLRTFDRLPADVRSAAAGRRTVDAVLRAAGLPLLVDSALLLVTELVTNAVVHGGTEVGLEIVIDAGELWVEVSDRSPGRIVLCEQPSGTRESGRGVYLLDALSASWGTRNSPSGKAVWFRLGEANLAPDEVSARPVEAGFAPLQSRRDLAFLLDLPRELQERLGPARVVEELLRRAVEGLGLERAWVFVASADGEWLLHAAYDDQPGPDPEEVRRGKDPAAAEKAGYGAEVLHGGGVPLGALVWPHVTLSDDDRALVRLASDRIGVIVRDEQARTAQLRSRGTSALLAEAGEMFAATLDVQLAATLAAQLVVPRLACWSAVWTTYGYVPVLQSVAHTEESRLEDLRTSLTGPLGRRLVADLVARQGGEPVVVIDACDLPSDGDALGSDEILLLPLVARRRMLGVLAVGRLVGRGYAQDEGGLLANLARVAALAVDNARLYEERASVAEALQTMLLPPELPVTPGVQFGARYAAAGEGNEVGGDFYDVFEIAESTWGIAIGDVCGKGASAAAITGIAREVLRLLSCDGQPPPAALRRLNETLLALGERGRFCTVVLGTVRRGVHGAVSVRFSSAGHPPPVHLEADGQVSFVGTSGTLLGVLADIDVSDDEIVLAPGESLVFYTDGVTERRGLTQMFGEDNLLAALRAAAGRPAGEVARLVELAVQQFDSGNVVARDDLAIFVVRAADADRP